MDKSVFNNFRRLVYEKSGISLSEKKEALVSARISKRMRALNMSKYKDYLDYVLADENGSEVVQLLDAISTNVTSFFREGNHFTILENALENWIQDGRKRFRIWSAACSTGEEPYSISMTVHHAATALGSDIRILATDISTKVLQKAKNACYTKEKRKQIPLEYQKYLEETGSEIKICHDIKRLVSFGRINLSEVPFPMQGPFDVIFCRNVMIYFDNDVRKALLTEISRLLRDDGLLFVGHAESLTGIMSNLKSLCPSVYIKRSSSLSKKLPFELALTNAS